MTVMRLFRRGIPHLPATEPSPIQDGAGSQIPLRIGPGPNQSVPGGYDALAGALNHSSFVLQTLSFSAPGTRQLAAHLP
jgi:hypothetical protein